MSAKPAADRQGCQRAGLSSRARGCVPGLGVASRPSQSREPPAQELAGLPQFMLGSASSDAPSRTLDQAFSAHSSRMMDDRRTGYRRTTTIVAAPAARVTKSSRADRRPILHERLSLWGATPKETRS